MLGSIKSFAAQMVILLFAFGTGASAQNEVDSLRKVVAQAEGSEKAEAIFNLAVALHAEGSQEGLALLDTAGISFLEIGDSIGWIRTEAKKVTFFQDFGMVFRAIHAYEKIDTLISVIDTSGLYKKTMADAALAYGASGKPEKGFAMLSQIYEYALLSQDTLAQIDMLENLTYENFAGPDKMRNVALYDSAIKLARAYSSFSPEGLASLYNNQASEMLMAGLLEQADSVVRMGREALQEVDEPERMLLYNYFTSAELALARGDLPACEDFFRKSGTVAEFRPGSSNDMVAKEALSHYHLLAGERAVSDQWFDRSYEVAHQNGNGLQIQQMYRLRSRLLKALGQFKDALHYFEGWSQVRDSMITVEQMNQLQELRIINETDLAETENRLLREQNQNILLNKRRDAWLFVIVLGFVLVAGGILIYFLARTRKLNNSIAAQNKRLTKLTDDNELLVGIVAHDLKAPLAKIESLLRLMLPKDELTPEKLYLLDMTMGVIEGGRTLVEDILLLSEAGRSSAPSLVKANLNEIIRSVASDFKDIAQRKNIQLSLDQPGQEITPWLHPPYMTRVLDNLVSNAIKFSPKGGKVRISWGEDKRGAWCTVTDSGLGIPESERDKLFKKFARLSNRPTAGESSSGLGLFIVKTLLDAMDATVSLEPEVEEGSAFTIRFTGRHSNLPSPP